MTLTERIERARRLLAAIEKNHSPATLASSFGAEDMVVLDLIARDGLAIRTFTLDTGRLPRETHALIADVRRRYGVPVDVFVPWPDSVDAYVAEHGRDGFYDGVAGRKACCAVRKVEPLRRALAGKRAWITGQRREHSVGRARLPERELDATHGLEKFNPLADWTEQDVWHYARSHRVPYNRLYDQGYRSIGCAPCTRPVQPNEDPRAGRWWWEQEGGRKECGLHEIPVKVVEKVERVA
jgi:phosphoadenosine phosphosulfate reductase